MAFYHSSLLLKNQAHFSLSQLKCMLYFLSQRVMGSSHQQGDRVSRGQSDVSQISQMMTGNYLGDSFSALSACYPVSGCSVQFCTPKYK